MAENTTRTQYNRPHRCLRPTFGRGTRENRHPKNRIATPHNQHFEPDNDY